MTRPLNGIIELLVFVVVVVVIFVFLAVLVVLVVVVVLVRGRGRVGIVGGGGAGADGPIFFECLLGHNVPIHIHDWVVGHVTTVRDYH